MTAAHDPIQSIRNAIAAARVDYDPVAVNKCLGSAGRQVIRALRDEEHLFNERVRELKAFVNESGMSKTLLLMPNFDSLNRAVRDHAPAQFLLLVAAMHHPDDMVLCDSLLVAAANLKTMQRQARQQFHVKYSWSWRRWLDHLEQVLPLIDHVQEPAGTFHLAGRELTCDDAEPVKLSVQQAAFMRLLIDHMGEVVSGEMFAEAGVANPADCKSKMRSKLEEAGMPFDRIVAAGDQGYRLIP